MEMQRKNWTDLTSGQKLSAAAAIVVQLMLLTAAQLDISRRPSEGINGNKKLWRAVVFINYFGPLAYFIFGIKRGAR
jgi:hypothetical protein